MNKTTILLHLGSRHTIYYSVDIRDKYNHSTVKIKKSGDTKKNINGNIYNNKKNISKYNIIDLTVKKILK